MEGRFREIPEPVLVVDDEAEVLALLAERLARAGLRAVTARSGAEALTCFERDRPFLVISDFRMPGGSGLELCAELGQRGSERPFLLLTGFASTEVARAAREAGAQLLAKPLDETAFEGFVNLHAQARLDQLTEERRDFDFARGLFVSEAFELLNELEAVLRREAAAPGGCAAIDELFRGVHTLKGSGDAFVEARELVAIAQAWESLLAQLRAERLPLDSSRRQLCHRSLLACRAQVEV